MSEHFIIVADGAHLRIYAEQKPPGQGTPGWESVEAMDFPGGHGSYVDRETDQAGRFPHASPRGSRDGTGSPGPQGAYGGGSIDERLPMKNEERKRHVMYLAGVIDDFLARRADATWDFAAGPEWQEAVLEHLSRESRERLRRTVSKNLVNQPREELAAAFASGGSSLGQR